MTRGDWCSMNECVEQFAVWLTTSHRNGMRTEEVGMRGSVDIDSWNSKEEQKAKG